MAVATKSMRKNAIDQALPALEEKLASMLEMAHAYYSSAKAGSLSDVMGLVRAHAELSQMAMDHGFDLQQSLMALTPTTAGHHNLSLRQFVAMSVASQAFRHLIETREGKLKLCKEFL